MQAIDCAGKIIEVGTRVRLTGLKPGDLQIEPDIYNGTVHSISDPDGDLDDYGRPVYWPAKVVVHFDDGTYETYAADGQQVCQDLEVCP